MSLDRPFLIIGHRGAAGLEPENTLRSFRRAIELGVDAVELDVHYIHGELIVIHDDTLDRTTNATGPLSAMSLTQIRGVDAGEGAQIPTLDESLETLLPHCAVNIELKGAATGSPVALKLARDYPDAEVLVSSFDHDELKVFHDALPQTPVAMLFGRNPVNLVPSDIGLDPWSVNISRRRATRSLIRSILDTGRRCLVYTVNDPDESARLMRDGATGVFTDFPDRVHNS